MSVETLRRLASADKRRDRTQPRDGNRVAVIFRESVECPAELFGRRSRAARDGLDS